jgi:hypothetical protein
LAPLLDTFAMHGAKMVTASISAALFSGTKGAPPLWRARLRRPAHLAMSRLCGLTRGADGWDWTSRNRGRIATYTIYRLARHQIAVQAIRDRSNLDHPTVVLAMVFFSLFFGRLDKIPSQGPPYSISIAPHCFLVRILSRPCDSPRMSLWSSSA